MVGDKSLQFVSSLEVSEKEKIIPSDFSPVKTAPCEPGTQVPSETGGY